MLGLCCTSKHPEESTRANGGTFRQHFALKVYCFGLVDEIAVKQHNFLYGEEHPSKGSDNVASIVFYYLQHLAPAYLRVVEHLIICTDGCSGENINKAVCAALRCFVMSNEWNNLRKATMIRMEVGHTKFSPDAGFGMIRNFEKNFSHETIYDVSRMITESTPTSKRNIGHVFDGAHFKKWVASPSEIQSDIPYAKNACYSVFVL